MATVQKSRAKSTSASKRATRPIQSTKDLARLTQQIAQMAAAFEKLQASGLLALARQMSVHSPRRPLPEYARVVAIGAADEVSDVRGRTGIVLDAAELDGGWTYTVYFPTQEQTYVLREISLWDTGETVPEDVIYGGGETRRVRVNAGGNGILVT
jgi:hypothetical protein